MCVRVLVRVSVCEREREVKEHLCLFGIRRGARETSFNDLLNIQLKFLLFLTYEFFALSERFSGMGLHPGLLKYYS